MQKDAYLVLENGEVFKGTAFGDFKEIISEIVFTTGMTGYLETLSDKSYRGQIVVQTFPLIGNYGVIPADFESEMIAANGYIVRDWCQAPSNFRSQGDVDGLLKERGVAGLCSIDTRRLTRILREHGVMNGQFTTDPDSVDLEKVRAYTIRGAVAAVSCKAPYVVEAPEEKYKVALMDFGLKENIKRSLLERGCTVIVVPHDTPAADILAYKPDGIMLSNGPGDPTDNPVAIGTIRELMVCGIPLFGICLGHQLLALANGFTTQKMKYGHRGANQPVRDLTTGKVYISSQNHGYAVVTGSVDEAAARELFVNVNDNTNEGLEYLRIPAFSVQFHPEASAGPLDSAFLFDRFIDRIKDHKGPSCP
ncbi:MAG: carbamoyl phosphate synthase small subunit [Christensenellales bacterium]|jgi:carbamoyl-phosphate synthase small subunit